MIWNKWARGFELILRIQGMQPLSPHTSFVLLGKQSVKWADSCFVSGFKLISQLFHKYDSAKKTMFAEFK